MTIDRAAGFDTLFRGLGNADSPGVSAMVIHQGEVLFAHGFGLANLEAHQPCGPETNYRLASVTKQFTAMAAILLLAKGKLSFDERLTDIFPEFPAYGKTITVRQLLSHTSGVLDYEPLIPNGTQIPVGDRDVLRLLMRQQTTYFTPGSRYRYSNSGYALLALAVESRSGKTFAHFLRHHIFEPLAMQNTLAYQPGLSFVPNRAFGYSRDGKGFKRTDQSLTSSVLGDGGIYSSVADLYHWDQALYNDQLVNRSLLREIFKPAVQTELPRTGYSLGWYVSHYHGVKELWHHGETIGFRTRIARFPQKRFTVIILANRSEAQLDELPHRIVDIYFGP
jgi:CubicO group peptidase (beta-lactamase class C family)